MAVFNLNVDMDSPCPECGKLGAINGGRCIDCAALKLKNKGVKNQMISDITVKKAVELLEGHLSRYKNQMSEAIMGDEDHVLSVSLPIKFIGKGTGVVVDVGISFATGKVKDSQNVFLDGKQIGLFPTE
jgi:hypothetical protein